MKAIKSNEEVLKAMKTYEIWSEGYIATGESGSAHYHGVSDGVSFKDACENLAKRRVEFAKHFVAEPRLSFWGCRLFDNRHDAQRSFG